MTPTEFLAACPEPRRAQLTALHRLIRRVAPELKPAVSGALLGYGPFHYRYASGREGDAFRFALANNKAAICLYVLAVDDAGYVAERYQDRLPRASIGKSCVRLKSVDGPELEVLEALLREAGPLPAEGETRDVSPPAKARTPARAKRKKASR